MAHEMTLPVDVEYCRPGEGELTAGTRLLERVARSSRVRFDYVVVDASTPAPRSSTWPTGSGCRLPVVGWLTDELPELFEAAQACFRDRPRTASFTEKAERVEVWDAEDFEPWCGLAWPAVRVIRYSQHRRSGDVVDAHWLTNLSRRQAGSPALYRMAKSRCQIENRFFNEGENLYGLEHIPHHHANSVLIHALLI